MRKVALLGACALATLLIMRASPAHAEFFVDAYVGPAFTQNDKWAGLKTKFDTEISFGGRIGYYFGFWPYLGLAVDASHYQPEGKLGGTPLRFDGEVTGVSFDAMLRFPVMKSNAFPQGQLQPYLMAGPGAYFSILNFVLSAAIRAPTRA